MHFLLICTSDKLEYSYNYISKFLQPKIFSSSSIFFFFFGYFIEKAGLQREETEIVHLLFHFLNGQNGWR